MNEADVLQTLAAVGAALTGFTGIVVAVGGRARGEWSAVELGQLHDLLWSSLHVVFFSFLPLIVVRALTPTDTWRVVSGAAAVMDLAFFTHYWRRGYRFFRNAIPVPIWGLRFGFMAIPVMVAVLFGKGAVALGFYLQLAPFIYLASLVLALGTAAVNFVYLLFPREQSTV